MCMLMCAMVIPTAGDSLCVNLCNDYECGQRWQTQGDCIRNRDDGKVLDIADHNSDAGARVCCWDHNGGPNQSWSFDYQSVQCHCKISFFSML